jgi:predicted metalloprotease with PDZ domain
MVVPHSSYRISLAERDRHWISVEVRVSGLTAGAHEAFMPVWTPGSYLVREYARHIDAVAAEDGDGSSLDVVKVAKNRWRVELPNGGELVLRYRVYSRDLTVRTNHVDERRAYWNGASTYLIVDERRDAPFDIHVDAPQGWRAVCGLEQEGEHWTAYSLDELVDTPFWVGDAPITEFMAAGKPHYVVHDDVEVSEHERLTEDLRKICETAAELFGGKLPYERYIFFLFGDEGGSGGLEHASSTVIHVPRRFYRVEPERTRLISLLAHEHFHVWNVKRIRPSGIAEFDYENENYTSGLWLSEGFTSFYQEIVPYRAGLYSRETFLQRIAENTQSVFEVPGRAVQSIAEASFDAWVKLYRSDENTRNTTVSYYSKGALAAFCLDALIVQHSGGEHSLDDVMRGLFADFEERGPGQDRELVLKLCSEAAGRDLSPEFAMLVDGREDPPLTEWLAPVGLRFEPPSGKLVADLGIQTAVKEGRLFVTHVAREGTGESLGLSPDDEIVALNGQRVLPKDWDKWLSSWIQPETEIELTLFRRGLQQALRGRIGGRREGKAQLVELEDSALRYRG